MRHQLNPEDQFNILVTIPLVVLMILSFPAAIEGFDTIREIFTGGLYEVISDFQNFDKVQNLEN